MANTSVQIVNVSEYSVGIGTVQIPSPYRSATFATGCANIDLANLSNIGERDVQRLISEGKILILPLATIS